MKKIKVNVRVKYSGKDNKWTFKEDLVANCIGTVEGIFNANGQIEYQVNFDNGIMTTIQDRELKLII